MTIFFKNLINKFKESKVTTKVLISIFIGLYLLLFALTLVKVNYTVLTPASLTPVDSYYQIEDSYDSGQVYTVSVYSIRKISLLQKLLATKNKDVYVYQEDPKTALTNKEEHLQGVVMKELSLVNSIINSYSLAKEHNEEIKINYSFKGVVINGKTIYASNDLQIGDVITRVNDQELKSYQEFIDILSQIDSGDSCSTNPTKITLTIKRRSLADLITVNIHKALDDNSCKIGIMTEEYYEIENKDNETFPNFKFLESRTIGPSGGLIQTIGIYNSLVKEDITKGHIISGTGTINADGSVGAIGGVKQKVIAANNAKVDIFFVPEANYQDALSQYNLLKKPHLKLVKVASFQEALDYLNSLEIKK